MLLTKLLSPKATHVPPAHVSLLHKVVVLLPLLLILTYFSREAYSQTDAPTMFPSEPPTSDSKSSGTGGIIGYIFGSLVLVISAAYRYYRAKNARVDDAGTSIGTGTPAGGVIIMQPSTSYSQPGPQFNMHQQVHPSMMTNATNNSASNFVVSGSGGMGQYNNTTVMGGGVPSSYGYPGEYSNQQPFVNNLQQPFVNNLQQQQQQGFNQNNGAYQPVNY